MNKKQIFGFWILSLISLMFMATIGCFTIFAANATTIPEKKESSVITAEFTTKAAEVNETAIEMAEWNSKGWIGVGAGLAIGLAGLGAAIGKDTGS